MKTKPITWNHFFLLVCLLLVSLGAYAQAASTETETEIDKSKLTIYSSNSNAVMVNILNLTPFDITYKEGTLSSQLDRDRKTKKSFTFAPLGIPGTICGTGSYPIEQADGTVAFDYKPFYHTVPECLERLQDATDPVVAPVPFMIAWEDDDGLVENSSLIWTVHDVICNVSERYVLPETGCALTEDFDGFYTYKADIDLGLWFRRGKAEKPRPGEFFRYSVAVIVHAAELLEHAWNPYSWKAMYVALEELAETKSDFDEWNQGDFTGAEMTFSAYPVPHEGSYCSDRDPACTPQAIGNGANDNVMVQWATSYTESAGVAEGSVVVITQVLRGHDPHNNDWTDEDGYLHMNFRYGSLTSVYITIMPPELYAAASTQMTATTASPVQLRRVLLSNGFGRIRQYLLRHGREGALALRDAVASLPPDDVQLLIQATQSTLTGQTRKEEERVLHTVAKALDKHH